MGAKGSCGKRNRAQHALTTMGSSVLRGALTTGLGILPLFFGGWAALDEFANNVLIIVVQGLFHGFVLLPLVLSSVGAHHPNDDNDTVEHGRLSVDTDDGDRQDEEAISPVHSPLGSPSKHTPGNPVLPSTVYFHSCLSAQVRALSGTKRPRSKRKKSGIRTNATRRRNNRRRRRKVMARTTRSTSRIQWWPLRRMMIDCRLCGMYSSCDDIVLMHLHCNLCTALL